MGPIVAVCSFNDAYAELAAVSITSLAHNNKRDCDVHIFENSLSEGAMAKVLSIQDLCANARITVHHVPDGAFAEVAEGYYGKETWYPLLAPEILGGLDRALVLEADTLVCRDVSDLYDMDLGGQPLACHRVPVPVVVRGLGKPTHFNAGVMLLNLEHIRKNDSFEMGKLTDTVRALRLRCKLDGGLWLAQEAYLNYILDERSTARFGHEYNFIPDPHRLMCKCAGDSLDEISESFLNPAIVHFAGPANVSKPTDRAYSRLMEPLRKWWDCHALSPFADPRRDAERLEEIIECRSNMKISSASCEDYLNRFLFEDIQEAVERLKRLRAEGAKTVFYGAGYMGTMFARLARSMGLSPDRICDLNKRGATVDGRPVESPDALNPADAGAIVALAIADPQSMAEAKNTLLGFGFPENRILPVFEQLSLGGRRWAEILGSLSPAP
jgi:lipopolysaccharide biosynthesis glycosyltransferase